MAMRKYGYSVLDSWNSPSLKCPGILDFKHRQEFPLQMSA